MKGELLQEWIKDRLKLDGEYKPFKIHPFCVIREASDGEFFVEGYDSRYEMIKTLKLSGEEEDGWYFHSAYECSVDMGITLKTTTTVYFP